MQLPSTVKAVHCPNGLLKYEVSSATCSATVYALGATVTSWAPSGAADVLWVSQESDFRVGKGIRGGIPICAPWFGAGRDDVEVPQPHGFVRSLLWRLVEASEFETHTTLRFELSPEDFAGSPGAESYPGDLTFSYEVSFGVQLRAILQVASATESFILDEALHTYFAVSDVREIAITGLAGEAYLDKVSGGAHEQSGDLTFSGETDLVFASTATITILDKDRRLRIDKVGSASTIVWNPWAARAQAMSAFADDEWPQMVCVEVGNALANAQHVPAGGASRMEMTISLTQIR